MRFKIRPIGNSAGIIFPSELLKKYNLHIGDELISQDNENSIVLTSVKSSKKYKLKDLVSLSISHNLTEEDKAWLDMEDIGNEVVW